MNSPKVSSSLKPALFGAVGGAVLFAIVGFTWGGWTTASTAEQTADQRASIISVAVTQEGLPEFVKKDVEYDNIRDNLAHEEWLPAPSGPCSASGGYYCRIYPELETCAGTGVAPCNFRWRHSNGTVLSISTAGEFDPLVTGWDLGK